MWVRWVARGDIYIYRNDDFYVPVLFHADDGLLLLARSCSKAENVIRLAIEVAGKCGLNINKGKSNVLVYNYREGGSS